MLEQGVRARKSKVRDMGVQDHQRTPNPMEYSLARALPKASISTLRSDSPKGQQAIVPDDPCQMKQEYNLTH